jgi:formylglycine-generating enzyme required for sulfatase activity
MPAELFTPTEAREVDDRACRDVGEVVSVPESNEACSTECSPLCDIAPCDLPPILDGSPETDGSICPDDGCCLPECDGKECGDDGCGGSCGECLAGLACQDGFCVWTCGDGFCDPNESCLWCADCGDCCGNGVCQSELDEDCASCVEDCPCNDELEECVLTTTGDWACTAAMIAIPAGIYLEGCKDQMDPFCDCKDEDDIYWTLLECPQVASWTDAYQIDVTEVTVAQYAAFLNAWEKQGVSNQCPVTATYPAADCLACETPWGPPTPDEPMCPFCLGGPYLAKVGTVWSANPCMGQNAVGCVTRPGAEEYCGWVGKQLCSLDMWEKAARGGCELYAHCQADIGVYPWGDSFPEACDGQTAAYLDCACDGGTCPVGTHPLGISAYEVHDMSGNVAEWVKDSESACSYRCDYESCVLRGGGFSDGEYELRSSAIECLCYSLGLGGAEPDTGVRCCGAD